MPGHDFIVIGASAGGVEALTQLAAGLPADLAASLFVVMHFPAQSTSTLPRILSRAGALPAGHACPDEEIRPGRIYVAPPNYHLPDSALYSGMPRSAIEHVSVDHVVPIDQMADLLARLVHEPVEVEKGKQVSEEMDEEIALSELDMEAVESEHHPGTPSSFACPECGGTLWELKDDALTRFRCRVGHAFSADSLLVEQSEAVEAALWTALRALEERIALERRLIARARQRGNASVVDRFDRQARDTERRAATIRDILTNGSVLDTATLSEDEVSVESEGHIGGNPAHGR